MSISLQSMELTRDAFQSLSLSIPIDLQKYQYLCLCLEKILNLEDERSILKETEAPNDRSCKSPSSIGNANNTNNNTTTTTSINNRNNNTKNTNITNNNDKPLYHNSEILSRVVFSGEIWLNDQICIRDIKIKLALLNEINALIEKEIYNAQSGATVNADVNVLNYYEKLLTAYKFLELPVSTNNQYNNSLSSYSKGEDYSLKEEEEEECSHDWEDSNTPKQIARTQSNSSSLGSFSKTYHSIFGNNINDSRELNTSSKNKDSISSPISATSSTLGNGQSSHSSNMSNPSTPTGNGPQSGNYQSNSARLPRKKRFSMMGNTEVVEEAPEDEKKQQYINSLLAKSKIYNKIRKNRDSSGSTNSMISNPTNISSRNSVTTTTSNMRRTSIQSPHEEQRVSQSIGGMGSQSTINSRHNSFISIVDLTSAQRQEIQKNKYEYYVQLKRLLKSINQILEVINVSDESKNLITLIEFIKRYIIKLVLIDTKELILQYLHFKEISFIKK